MDAERVGQRVGIPASGIQVHFVPGRDEPASQIGDVHLRAAALGQDIFVTQGDLHRHFLGRLWQLPRCVMTPVVLPAHADGPARESPAE